MTAQEFLRVVTKAVALLAGWLWLMGFTLIYLSIYLSPLLDPILVLNEAKLQAFRDIAPLPVVVFLTYIVLFEKRS